MLNFMAIVYFESKPKCWYSETYSLTQKNGFSGSTQKKHFMLDYQNLLLSVIGSPNVNFMLMLYVFLSFFFNFSLKLSSFN